MKHPFDTDVLIIGGGPAGLAAALAARGKGFRVTVADGACPPVDKACGEGLMPDSIAALARLGVDASDLESHRFRGIRFIDADASVDASFPVGQGLGIRRVVLHQALIDLAEAAGVKLLWSAPVSGIRVNAVQVRGSEITARWIIGADGEASRVRHWAGLDYAGESRTRFGFRRHFRIEPWTNCMELYWGSVAQVYVTPVAPEEVCVALISRDPHLRLEEGLAGFPALAARLRDRTPASTERGSVTITRRLPAVTRRNIALIGDASGSVDAITGEGLCLAFKQASALAQALEKNDLASYEKAHRNILRRPAFMAEFMLMLEFREGLRRRSIRAMGKRPELFANLLAMHVGACSPLRFAATGLALGWRLIAA